MEAMEDLETEPVTGFESEALSSLRDAWLAKARRAREHKHADFTTWANEGLAFYTGDQSARTFWSKYMVGDRGIMSDENHDSTRFMFCSAKTSELVQLIGPVLYDRNPVRTVTPRPVMEIRKSAVVDPRLERRIQQLQQQIQQAQPPQQPAMPGQPPQPPAQPQIPPQLQMELQALQQSLQQQQQRYDEMVLNRQEIMDRRQLRADMLSQLLNYTPNEFDLKSDSRDAVDEALIKGMGVMWTDRDTTEDGRTVLVSRYDSVDALLVDPDAEHWSQIKWIMMKCRDWVYDVADEYGIPVDLLKRKGTLESATLQEEKEMGRSVGDVTDRDTKDVLVYYKIWSRMGAGQTLAGVPPEYRPVLESFGDNVYLVIAEGIDYPLNLKEQDLAAFLQAQDGLDALEPDETGELPPEAEMLQQVQDVVFEQVQWPVPYWLDNRWPVSCLAFHKIPNCVWPQAHIKTGLPFLKYTNHVMSRSADVAHQTSRLIVGLAAGMEEEAEKKLRGGDAVTVVEVKTSEGKKVSDMMDILKLPQGGLTDLMTVGNMASDQFDKATGLTELAYAMPGGMRSAAEAQVKAEAKNIRPDDMAQKTEEWMTEVARKEALGWIWLAQPEDVAPILGDDGAALWGELVSSQDPVEVAQELDFRIEAGSMRKVNRDTEIQQSNEAVQALMPALQQLAMSGNPGPFNGLMTWWAKVRQINNIGDFLLPPPAPPQPDPRIQMEQQRMAGEERMAQQEHQMKMVEQSAEMQAKQAELQMKAVESRMKLEAQQQKAAIDAAKAEQEMLQDQQRFAQEQSQTAQRGQLQTALEVERARARAQNEGKKNDDS